jgi:pimeloyl-ACP methyl ester carboxylesterase
MSVLRIILFFVYISVFNASAGIKYLEEDISCPEPSETSRYIKVPMFHDLESMAKVENISELNVHAELQWFHQGYSFKVFYELLAPYDKDKELLIMIPGGPGQTHTFIHNFQDSFEGFNEFAKDYNVIVMDHRGVGCSRYSGPGEYPSKSLLMRQAASDIELIRKSFDDKKINVWGYSYGSMLAQTYALLYPNSVSKLFLGGAFSAASDFIEATTTFEQRVLKASPKLVEDYHFLKLNYSTYAHKLLKIAEEYMYKYTMYKRDLVELAVDVVEAVKAGNFDEVDDLLEYNGAYVMEWMMRSISCIEIFPNELEEGMFPMFWEIFSSCREFRGDTEHFNYTKDLINIKAPTFIWGGEFDHVTTATAMRKMSKVIPNNYLYIDKHIAHGIDKPECFIEMMSAFFQNGVKSESLDAVKMKSICVDEPEIETDEEDEDFDGATQVSRIGIL